MGEGRPANMPSPRRLSLWEENLAATSWPDYLYRYSVTKGQAVHQGAPPMTSTHNEHWLKEMAFHPILQRWLNPRDEAIQEEEERREADRLINRNKGTRAAMPTTKNGEFSFRMAPELDKRKPYGVPLKLRSNLYNVLGEQEWLEVTKVPHIRNNANGTRADHHIINHQPLPGVIIQGETKQKATVELPSVSGKEGFRLGSLQGRLLTKEGCKYECQRTRTVERFQRRLPPPSMRAYNWMTLAGEGGEDEVLDLYLGNRRKNVSSIVSSVKREREAQVQRDMWRLHHHAEVREAYTAKIMAEPFRSKKGGYVKKEEDFPHGYNIVNLAPSCPAAAQQQATEHAPPPVTPWQST